MSRKLIIAIVFSLMTLGTFGQVRLGSDAPRTRDRERVTAPSTPGDVAATAASRSRRARPFRAPEKVEIEGWIAAIAADSLTVSTQSKGDFTVSYDATTAIRMGDTVVGSDMLQVGDHVHVRAFAIEGALQAGLIIMQAPDQPDTGEEDPLEVEVQGTVTALYADSLDLLLEDGSTVTVLVDGSTLIKMSKGGPVPFSSIVVGDILEVDGIQVDATTIQAKKISIEQPEVENVELSGTVTELGDMLFVVDSPELGLVEVHVDDSTNIKKQGKAIDFSEIAVGDVVEVKGVMPEPGVVLASRIIVQVPEVDEASIEGTIESIGVGELTVTTESGPVVVSVSADTMIKRNGSPAVFEDLMVGDRVEAEGVWDGDVLDAAKISAEAPEAEEVEIEGTIESIGDGELTVTTDGGPVVVSVSGDTTIERNGAAATFEDLVVGDHVEVEGVWDGDVLAAASIDAEAPEAEMAEISGTISAIGDGEITVETDGGPVVVSVTADTVITLDGSTALITDLVVGQRVEASGVWDGDVLVASSIDAETGS